MKSKIKKVKIAIVLLGHQKHRTVVNRLENHSSKLFEVEIKSAINILPNADLPDWSYSVDLLENLTSHQDGYDYTIGIIDSPIQYNFYMAQLSKKTAAISMFQVTEILDSYEIDALNYLLCCAYITVVEYHMQLNNPDIPELYLFHDETRSCIFDFVGHKEEIHYFCKKASLCSDCENKLNNIQMPDGFVHILKQELKKVKQKTYYKLKHFIKKNPVLAITITIITTIVLNLISNSVYTLWVEKLIKSFSN